MAIRTYTSFKPEFLGLPWGANLRNFSKCYHTSHETKAQAYANMFDPKSPFWAHPEVSFRRIIYHIYKIEPLTPSRLRKHVDRTQPASY